MPPSKGTTKEERATKARLRASQLEIGADYLAICQVINIDPKLLQAVSRELIAQGALTSVQLENCGPVQSRHREAESDGRGRETASPELHQKVGVVRSVRAIGDAFVKDNQSRVVQHAI